jgi:DNA-binding response OmpR family regulator
MSRPLVVIAEDEPRLAQALAFMLQQEGLDTLVASDGQAALRLAQESQPDLLLLDLDLPELDGLSVCRLLRADPATASLPIFVLSALGQREHERAALEAGATTFFRKPFPLPALRDRIRAQLGLD